MSVPLEKGIEFKVGLFVLIGLLFIAVMAVKFGQVGQGFQKFYDLHVELPNASGLIKNSDVQLAGARIGYVADRPQISASAASVTITVRVADKIKIPRLTRFQVNSSGLLGDKFVEIIPDEKFDPATFDPNDPAQTWNSGERVKGTKSGGLDLEALQKKVDVTLDTLTTQISEEMGKLKSVTDKIDNDILSETNRKNIADTFASLKTSSEGFAKTSKDLNSVVLSAQGTMDSAKKTMTTADAAAGDLRKAIGDARNTLGSVQGLVSKAQTGDGLIPTLLNNRQLSENLNALVVNLRRHGILFYKDRAAQLSPQSADPSAPAPSPARQSQQPQRLQRSF